MVEKARALYEELRLHVSAEYDDSGAIGRRYRRQDEIGTPWAFTIDEQTLEDGSITAPRPRFARAGAASRSRLRASSCSLGSTSPWAPPRARRVKPTAGSTLVCRYTWRLRRSFTPALASLGESSPTTGSSHRRSSSASRSTWPRGRSSGSRSSASTPTAADTSSSTRTSAWTPGCSPGCPARRRATTTTTSRASGSASPRAGVREDLLVYGGEDVALRLRRGRLATWRARLHPPRAPRGRSPGRDHPRLLASARLGRPVPARRRRRRAAGDPPGPQRADRAAHRRGRAAPRARTLLASRSRPARRGYVALVSSRADAPRQPRLRAGNLALALIHAGQAALILVLTNDFGLPVTESFLDSAPGHRATPTAGGALRAAPRARRRGVPAARRARPPDRGAARHGALVRAEPRTRDQPGAVARVLALGLADDGADLDADRDLRCRRAPRDLRADRGDDPLRLAHGAIQRPARRRQLAPVRLRLDRRRDPVGRRRDLHRRLRDRGRRPARLRLRDLREPARPLLELRREPVAPVREARALAELPLRRVGLPGSEPHGEDRARLAGLRQRPAGADAATR